MVPNSNLAVLLKKKINFYYYDDQGRIVTFWGIKSNEIMGASSDGATLYLTRTLL